MLNNLYMPSTFLNGQCLQFVNEHDYLGVNISDHLSVIADMKHQVKYFYGQCNSEIIQFSHCKDENKVTLLKGYCSNFYSSCLSIFSISRQILVKLTIRYSGI